MLKEFTYFGERTGQGCEVSVRDEVLGGLSPLPLRLDLVRHSPAGFEWGYLGSGPSQLAFAVLMHHFQHGMGRCANDAEELARRHYQYFKIAVVAKLPCRSWSFNTAYVELSAVDRHGELL